MANSLLYRLLRRVLRLDVSHLLVSERDIPFEAGRFEFRRLTSDDIVRYAKDPTKDLDATMASRLDFGLDFCFGAFDQSELVSYCWVALQNIEPEHNKGSEAGTALAFDSDTAYVYKAFTCPQWRGQKIFPRVLGFAFHELSGIGAKRFVSTTGSENGSANRVFWRSGFRSIGKVWFCGWIPALKLKPAKVATMGIRIGSAAQFTHRKATQAPVASTAH